MTARTQHTAGGSDAGFTALELVVITPVLVVMLLLVVGFGRLTHGRQLVDQAAAAAARAGPRPSTRTRYRPTVMRGPKPPQPSLRPGSAARRSPPAWTPASSIPAGR